MSIIRRIMSQRRRQHAPLSLATPKGLPGDRGVCMRYRSGRSVPPLGAHLTYRVRKLTSNSSELMAHAVTSRGLFGKHFDRSLSHRDPFMRSANDLGLKRSRTLSQYTEHPYLQSGHPFSILVSQRELTSGLGHCHALCCFRCPRSFARIL